MSASEFEQVYKEAFLSGTGRTFDDGTVQAEYLAFSQRANLETLETWTNPEGINQPSVVLNPDRWSISHTIKHPSRVEFDAEELELASRTRFLGRSLINTARSALQENSFFQQAEGGDLDFMLMHRLRSFNWYDNHQDVERDNLPDQDAPSPTRLRDWPYGKMINCLGASIATAAACEIDGKNYLYASEVRSAQEVINEQYANFRKTIDKLFPGFYKDEDVISAFNHQDLFTPSLKSSDVVYREDMFKPPRVLRELDPTPRDFHHYSLEWDEKNSSWVQLDPFMIIFSPIPDGDNFNRAANRLIESKDPSEVILHDQTPRISGIYHEFQGTIDTLKNYNQVFDKVARETDDSYKSSKYMSKLFSFQTHAIEVSAAKIYKEINETDAEAIKELGASVSLSVWVGSLAAFLRTEPDGALNEDKFIKMLDKFDESLGGDSEEAIKQLSNYIDDSEAAVHKIIQQDTLKKERFIHLVKAAPYIAVNIWYRRIIIQLGVRGNGTANTSAEFSEPEFMIGAMYLNHYATWRKDGRINIARHLARMSPSQLLWQASMQDGVADERVVAMGEIIRDLKPRTLHPLVNIASSIVPTKERR